MQFWPRKRAKGIVARVRHWATHDTPKLLGYLGYKAGMTHIQFSDDRKTSLTKGMTVAFPVTVIECPSLLPVSLCFYKSTPSGLQRNAEVFSEKLDKSIKKPKKAQKEPKIGEFDEIRIKIITQPKLTSIGKKKPDIIEIPISGKPEEVHAYAKQLLTREIKVSELFKEGQFVDIHAVTKGHGFQGTVKRYGVKIRQHKSEKVKRGVGTLGSWTPKRVSWTVAQPGKMGFHTRTEYNKHIIKINNTLNDINPKGGFVRYGFVKNEYLLLKGSIPGPKKRPVILTEPIRPTKNAYHITTTYVHKESQQ